MSTSLLDTRRVHSILVGVLCLFFVLRGLVNTWNEPSPEGDQGSFIDLALNIREGRGFVATAPCPMMLDRGHYPPEAGRQPLYPFLLALIARRDPVFFTEAKLITLLTGVLALACFWRLALRCVPGHTALLATVLLASNISLHVFAVHVVAEAPLMLFFGMACLLVWEGFDRPSALPWAGLAAGAAYLCKGTAVFLPAAFAVAAVTARGARVLRDRGFWLFWAAFLLAGSPLFVRNTLVFGRPFYNYNSAHVFWLDNWAQFWTPFTRDTLPGMSSFFQFHSLPDALARLGAGAKDMIRVMPTCIHTMPGALLPWPPAQRLSPYVLFCLALCDAVRPHHRGRQTFAICLTVAFFVAFSWYIFVAFSMRFLLPLVPLYCLCAARTITALIEAGCRRLDAATAVARTATAWICAGLCVIMLAATAWHAHKVAWACPLSAAEFAQDRRGLADWLVTQTPRDAVLCYGPEQHLWLWLAGRHTIFLPTVEDAAEIEGYLRRFNAAYLIIDAPSLRRRPLLRRYFSADDGGTLRLDRRAWLRDFPRWALVFHDSPRPRFMVFQADARSVE